MTQVCREDQIRSRPTKHDMTDFTDLNLY